MDTKNKGPVNNGKCQLESKRAKQEEGAATRRRKTGRHNSNAQKNSRGRATGTTEASLTRTAWLRKRRDNLPREYVCGKAEQRLSGDENARQQANRADCEMKRRERVASQESKAACNQWDRGRQGPKPQASRNEKRERVVPDPRPQVTASGGQQATT